MRAVDNFYLLPDPLLRRHFSKEEYKLVKEIIKDRPCLPWKEKVGLQEVMATVVHYHILLPLGDFFLPISANNRRTTLFRFATVLEVYSNKEDGRLLTPKTRLTLGLMYRDLSYSMR